MKESKFAFLLVFIGLFMCFSIDGISQNRDASTKTEKGSDGFIVLGENVQEVAPTVYDPKGKRTRGGVTTCSGCPGQKGCTVKPPKPHDRCVWISYPFCKWLCLNGLLSSPQGGDVRYPNAINIGPNPFTTEINLNSTEEKQITIYSLDGQVVYQTTISGTHQINTNAYKNGMYILEVIDDDAIYRENILKIE